MKKKLLIILVTIIAFMITPNVEAKEIELSDLYNYRCDNPKYVGDVNFDYDLSPGDIFIFDSSKIKCSQSTWINRDKSDRVYIFVDNKYYENQEFVCQSKNDNCKYTVLSYEELTKEEPPRGKTVKIVATGSHLASTTYNVINIYYQLIGTGEKFVDYKNLFDATNDNPTAYYEGETDILLSDPVREGYKFLGWYTSPTFEEDTRVTMITKDEPDELVLYAKWEKEEENIFTNPNTSSMFYIAMGIVFILILGTALVIVYKYKKIGKDE